MGPRQKVAGSRHKLEAEERNGVAWEVERMRLSRKFKERRRDRIARKRRVNQQWQVTAVTKPRQKRAEPHRHKGTDEQGGLSRDFVYYYPQPQSQRPVLSRAVPPAAATSRGQQTEQTDSLTSTRAPHSNFSPSRLLSRQAYSFLLSVSSRGYLATECPPYCWLCLQQWECFYYKSHPILAAVAS